VGKTTPISGVNNVLFLIFCPPPPKTPALKTPLVLSDSCYLILNCEEVRQKHVADSRKESLGRYNCNFYSLYSSKLWRLYRM
jgi:hypothetical protein